MTKTQAIILGKFLVGESEIPELYKVRIKKNCKPNIWLAIQMLKGAPDLKDKTLRYMVMNLFKGE